MGVPSSVSEIHVVAEVRKVYTALFLYSVCVYGGGNRKEQVKIVSRGVEIVIGMFK